ncbi:hypothetical protein GCM10028778_12560 [Barrientosiimonas marina]|uniref:Uncharacterized protein n=1 Tax=Lentibacillus kimchii TaxID=1542911 RepID=A0ABW2UT43_9BACI
MVEYSLLKEPDTAIQEINQKVGQLDKIKLSNNLRGQPFDEFRDWRSGVSDLLADLFADRAISQAFLTESEFIKRELPEDDTIKQLNEALDKSKIYLEQLNNGIKMGAYRPLADHRDSGNRS